jgi:hypothetical protein
MRQIRLRAPSVSVRIDVMLQSTRRMVAGRSASGSGALRVLLPLATASILLSGCAPSSAALRDAVEDEPGVLRVSVGEGGGDNDIPFARIPKSVTVRMVADASREQVMAVFDSYDEEIEDGDVVSVDVILDGPKRATLSSGEGIKVTQQMVDELVDVQQDDAVAGYRREAYPVLPSVRVELASAGFDEVVRVADSYRNAEDIEAVDVVSGDFVLIRDEVNEDLRVTAAREEVVRDVGAQFLLRGAIVAGRGPLELIVHAADVAAVRGLVERTNSGLAGKVVVGTSRLDQS